MKIALKKLKRDLVDIVTNQAVTDYKTIVELEIQSIEAQLKEIN